MLFRTNQSKNGRTSEIRSGEGKITARKRRDAARNSRDTARCRSAEETC